MILLTRIVWGMWRWRDLTSGDTSSYYHNAMTHSSGEALSLVFSPLYLSFYRWFGRWFEDAFVATLLHRIVILALLGSSLLLLARALLPKPVAWLVAAWWLVLPIDWNALYEVHLFGFIPLALGCWLMGGRMRTLSLALGLALVWSGALLVRNEYVLSVPLLAACCVFREWVVWKRVRGSVAQLFSRVVVLTLPSLLVVLLAVAAWHRSWQGWRMLQAGFHARHTLNMAQVYPFSYRQRHPEWTKNPWTEGGELMKEKFGESMLTFSEAVRRNPGAMWEHVLWHVRLLPSGLELGLFNCHFGAYSPDFTRPRPRPVTAAVLSVLLIMLVMAGIWCLWVQRPLLKRFIRSRRIWCWVALVCLLPPCLVAIITQRPRPSYIFPLTFFVMAFAGLCLYAILRRIKLWRHFKAVFPLLMVAITLTASPEKTTAQLYRGQPLQKMYHHLFPFRDYLQQSNLALAARHSVSELNCYLNLKAREPHGFRLGEEVEQTAATFENALEQHEVGTLYLKQIDLRHPAVKEWVLSQDPRRWKILANHERTPNAWMLLTRQESQ
jgi:hypothetical protein